MWWNCLCCFHESHSPQRMDLRHPSIGWWIVEAFTMKRSGPKTLHSAQAREQIILHQLLLVTYSSPDGNCSSASLAGTLQQLTSQGKKGKCLPASGYLVPVKNHGCCVQSMQVLRFRGFLDFGKYRHAWQMVSWYKCSTHFLTPVSWYEVRKQNFHDLGFKVPQFQTSLPSTTISL